MTRDDTPPKPPHAEQSAPADQGERAVSEQQRLVEALRAALAYGAEQRGER